MTKRARPWLPPYTRAEPTLIERHVLASMGKPFECWPYPGFCRSNGYAQAYVTGRKRPLSAHRATYLMCVGPIPDGLVLDHLCRNPSCCNPLHLEPVTQLENMRRGAMAQKTHCPYGHPLSGDNLRITTQGRRCKDCAQRRQRARHFGKQGREVPPLRDTSEACIHGHRWAEHGYKDSKGHHVCRECRRAMKARQRGLRGEAATR